MLCRIIFVLSFIVLFAQLRAQSATLPPGPTGSPSSGWPYPANILPWAATCMQARNQYWANNGDVARANLDPVYHYQNGGFKEGRAWSSDLCNTNPIYPNNSICNCSSAQTTFVNTYTWVPVTTGNAWEYWLEWTPYYSNGGKVWHCDYCMSALIPTTGTASVATTGGGSTTGNPYILPDQCQCWQAREKYWNQNKDVYSAGLDPVSHYESSGGKEGRTWDCSMCDVNPILAYNSSCNCPDAANKFISDNPRFGATVTTAWNVWVGKNKAGESEGWHCEFCIPELLNIYQNNTGTSSTSGSGSGGAVPHYNLPWSCQCVQAGNEYLNANPDVMASKLDPVYHYESSGYFQNRPWDCSICSQQGAVWPNDTLCNCSAAIAIYENTYSTFKIPYGQAFSFWWNNGTVFGQSWNCTPCIAARDAAAAAALAAELAAHRIRAFDTGISGGLGAVVGAAALIGLFAAVMLAMFWTSFSKHGSFYSAVIVMGVAISYVAALTQLPRPTDALCTAFPWLLGTAFILVYGCLFIKTWALYKVWKDASNFKRSNLTPTTILKIIGGALVIEFAFLAVWTGVDRPKVVLAKTVDGDYQHLCKCDNIVFWAIFLGVKGAWMVFGAALSILTRNIAKEYSESRSIGYAIYNDIAILIVAIPLAILLQNIPGGVIVIEVAVIVITFTFTMCILFFDVWWGIFFPEKDMISSIKMGPARTNSTSPHNSGTTTTRASSVRMSTVQSTNSANSSHSSA